MFWRPERASWAAGDASGLQVALDGSGVPMFINLAEEASSLPQAWRSKILGRTGGANIKIIRMDEAGIPTESHADFDEGFLVVEGHMTLEIEGRHIAMKAGDFYLVPAGQPHSVLPGARGVLFLIDAE
ncbi:cupin domain-containing protein [Caulobacter vibrioides]|uniref:Cupin type-2 domain-containing protein n=2 Tax=Caulobacter vibrioides TaxID=155892 RepID=Q9A3P5_CAUVC|nr:cupin domain-containing protein [Caulobacter vibrioides]YP_002518632.3 cupin domain-containing protein [Caulobacter vibrioides NA1000]AAK25119.1 hypothetical protein CC_3157 [Caulobacter vibrioides CB15]ACL96724.3 cupin domain-containing protein [Caulobacter vibrioides NA1000]ATC29984.1 cupin domain-containing protein [Caulobacter vibrioides]QXZ51506.1 cupin domain-containing protein [Caulobacter vibrioides]